MCEKVKQALIIILPILICFFIYNYIKAFDHSLTSHFESLLKEKKTEYLKLPNDRYLEYYDFGATKEDAKHTIVMIHGAMTSGNVWKIHESWAKEKKVRIISPSLPGWGLTSFLPINENYVKFWTKNDATVPCEFFKKTRRIY